MVYRFIKCNTDSVAYELYNPTTRYNHAISQHLRHSAHLSILSDTGCSFWPFSFIQTDEWLHPCPFLRNIFFHTRSKACWKSFSISPETSKPVNLCIEPKLLNAFHVTHLISLISLHSINRPKFLVFPIHVAEPQARFPSDNILLCLLRVRSWKHSEKPRLGSASRV